MCVNLDCINEIETNELTSKYKNLLKVNKACLERLQ